MPKIIGNPTGILNQSSAPVLQDKTVAPSTSQQVITADSTYDGLNQVIVEAATLHTKTITPTTELQTITPNEGYYGLRSVRVRGVTAEIDENIIPENIAEGVTILGVEGTHSGSGGGGDVEEALLTRTITEYSNNTLTKIGDYAFAGCTKLESINVQNVTSVGSHAFYNCDKLTSISLPNLLTVGDHAFSSCDKLNSVDIPNVRSIDSYAFAYSTALTEITIPENVTTLASDIFYKCPSLQSAVCLGDITKVAANVFYECSNLKTIDFTQCTSVPTFSNNNYVENFVRNHSDELKIYVPWSLYSEWKSNEQWSYWADHIYYRMIEDVPTISLNGNILTMNDPSGIATSFDVYAFNDDNSYSTVVEGNTIDLSTLCEESGTYTVEVYACDTSGRYGDSFASDGVQYTYTKLKLDAPEIWLEGYTVTVHVYESDWNWQPAYINGVEIPAGTSYTFENVISLEFTSPNWDTYYNVKMDATTMNGVNDCDYEGDGFTIVLDHDCDVAVITNVL